MFLVDSGSRFYVVSNDIMKSAILEISNCDISATGCLIDFMFDCRCLLSAVSVPHHLPACTVDMSV